MKAHAESARLEAKSQSNADSIWGVLKESKRHMGLSEKMVSLNLRLNLTVALLWEWGVMIYNNYIYILQSSIPSFPTFSSSKES